MQQIGTHDFLMVRNPAVSYKNYNVGYLAGFIKTSFLQLSIYFASPHLYHELEKYNFEYPELPSKVKFSLWKYFNRMCFRSTPFGLLASFSATRWQEAQLPLKFEKGNKIFINDDLYTNFKTITDLDLPADPECYLYSNSSIYKAGGDIRYYVINFQCAPPVSEIASCQSSVFLDEIIKFCKVRKRRSEVTAYLHGKQYEEDQIKIFIDELLDAQLLFSDMAINISGQLFPDRVMEKVKAKLGSTKNIFGSQILQDPKTEDLERVLTNIKELKNKAFYCLFQKNICTGVPHEISSKLIAGIKALVLLAPKANQQPLEKFKKEFLARYEDREIPLLTALDPQLGISYRKTEQFENSQFISKLELKEPTGDNQIDWGDLQKLLMSKWVSSEFSPSENVININQQDLEKYPDKRQRLPPGFHAVFGIHNGQIIFEQIGGVSSVPLHARFTPFDNTSRQAMKDIVKQEDAAFEPAIVADVVFSGMDKSLNINARANLFSYEIPFLVNPGGDVNVIGLNDIKVRVTNGKIILKSAKLNKVIIPRIASAYNYSLHESPLCKFLGDLQYQDLLYEYKFELSKIFPGLSAYPRVEVLGNIVCRAKWVFSINEFNNLCVPDNIKQLLGRYHIPDKVCLISGDSHLVFDLKREEDIQFLKACVKGQNDVVLEEYLLDNDSVVDQFGQPHISQFVASIFSNEFDSSISRVQEKLESKKSAKVKRFFVSGDQWIYLKIYCHPVSSDKIINELYKKIIKGLMKAGLVQKWFFIRYNEGGDHLRLRVMLTEQGYQSNIAYKITHLLENGLNSGIISNIMQDVYQRELERYDKVVIEEVEQFFYSSSLMVISILDKSQIDRIQFKIEAAMKSGLLLLEVFFGDERSLLSFLTFCRDSLQREFGTGKEATVDLDQMFRKMPALSNVITHYFSIATANQFKRTLTDLKIKIMTWPDEKKIRLLADLLHMHFNRVFSENQRKYEYVTYYFLHKYIKSVIARKGLAG